MLKGSKDAKKIGEILNKKKVLPDLIVSSPALRARETAQIVAKQINYKNHIMYNEVIYEAFLNEFGYDTEMPLDRDRLGVYYFDNHKIENLEVTETGIAIPSINEAIDDVDNRLEKIYYSIFEEEPIE